MKCLSCKKGTLKADFEPYFAKLSSGYLIIENVPCQKCDECGEILFSMSVIEKIEDIIAFYEKLHGKIFIIDYNNAA